MDPRCQAHHVSTRALATMSTSGWAAASRFVRLTGSYHALQDWYDLRHNLLDGFATCTFCGTARSLIFHSPCVAHQLLPRSLDPLKISRLSLDAFIFEPVRLRSYLHQIVVAYHLPLLYCSLELDPPRWKRFL